MNARSPRDIHTRKTRLGADADRADREFWAALTPEDRVLETWRLSLELWRMTGRDTGEPGLHRTVARVVRR